MAMCCGQCIGEIVYFCEVVHAIISLTVDKFDPVSNMSEYMFGDSLETDTLAHGKAFDRYRDLERVALRRGRWHRAKAVRVPVFPSAVSSKGIPMWYSPIHVRGKILAFVKPFVAECGNSDGRLS